MKKQQRAWLVVFLMAMFIGVLTASGSVLAQEPGFTRQDRDLLIELRTRMLEIDKRFEQINKIFEQIDKRFEQVDKRFEQIEKRFEQIDKRFEQIDKRFEQVDKRFEQVDKRFEQLMHFLYILAGIFTSLVVAVIGFAYWDRRTIISQAKKETKEDLEREGRLRDVILALREFAAKNEDLASILRSYHLL
ncbi:coiled-coil domain-containing protein [Desulfosoma caldarium]|uniref:N1221-like protein n=1 Tax=Desulfosoma caldarium TaxID=610254 RepID=A0A3N1UQE7_9BACT|nr:hypothetical protein [Desulfosoma caldarium]ROQ93344.1 N1221-like protein [Desulfosoma caldarium]